MTDARDADVKRPSGVVVFGWVAIFFCGLLAFINAALATEVGFRIFFLVCGALLAVIGVIVVVRWYAKARARG